MNSNKGLQNKKTVTRY